MGTCAMTIIHHGLCHPGITVELQHRPADVWHAARARGGGDNLPPLLNKCCLLPALLYTQSNTHKQMQIIRMHEQEHGSTCTHTHKHLLSHAHVPVLTHKHTPEICKLPVTAASLLFIVSLPCNNAGSLSAIN